MNKVVCNVCGTTYPENAAQCPICGFARASDSSALGMDEGAESTYTYVKGGRFSKANVRKRNQSSQSVVTESDLEAAAGNNHRKKTSRAGSLIVVIILLLAIIVVVGYIALRFFIPNDYFYDGLDNFKSPTAAVSEETETEATTPTTVDPETDEVSKDIPCTDITLSDSAIELDSLGASFTLQATVVPADTTDDIVFSSSDKSVASVDGNGTIVANGEGSAIITVTCGAVKAECTVVCKSSTEPEIVAPVVELMLNRKEITFQSEGESWMLYDGSIAVSAIIWSSDDNAVAMITDGKVVAVGNGDTVVYGTYEDQTVSCVIHCDFSSGEGQEGSGGISEAGSDSTRTCKLYNPYGNAEDVTIQVDEEFTLMLVDENTNEISGATWNVSDPEVCSYSNGIVKGLKSGYAEVSAVFEGATYTCIVRVA